MSESLLLAGFDVDGTIKTKAGVPSSIHEGILSLQQKGVITTLLTGRGYVRLLQSLGESYKKVVLPNSPLALETGGRIARANGSEDLKYYPLGEGEIDAVLATIDGENIQFLAYFPKEIQARALVWTPRAEAAEDLARQLGNFADISTETKLQLAQRIRNDLPCMFNLKSSISGLMGYLPRGLNTVENEGMINVNHTGIDKKSGITDIADILDVSLDRVLVVGNDTNDIPMLTIPAVRRIIVGDLDIDMTTSRVNTPDELGRFLSSLDI